MDSSYVTISDKGWIESTQSVLERKVSIWRERNIECGAGELISVAQSFIALLSFRAVTRDSITVTLSKSDALILKRLLEG